MKLDSLERAFQNLSLEELEQTQGWFRQLCDPEQDRLLKTLDVLNSTPLLLHNSGNHYHFGDNFAVIVAGTSIDTNTYTDINLFMLPRHSLADTFYPKRKNPTEIFLNQLNGSMPEHAYAVEHQKRKKIKFEVEPEKLVYDGSGAVIIVSLFYEGFSRRRPHRHSDFLEPTNSPLDAEGIIRHNRDINSKFLVISCDFHPVFDRWKRNLFLF